MDRLVSPSSIRAAVFFIIVFWMCFGPIYTQLFGRENVLFRHWVMFSGIGIGVVDAAFYDASGTRLDYARSLGYPRSFKLMQVSDQTIFRIGQKLCADDGDIRASARIATPSGWETLVGDSQIICPESR
jgi:hypothetical protein